MSVEQLVVLTDRAQARGHLVDVLRAAVRGGATAVLLREKDLSRPQRAELAKAILGQLNEPAPEGRPWPPGTPPRSSSCRALHRAGDTVARRSGAGTRLLVASDAELAVEVGADGVHLAAADPWPGDLLAGAGRRKLLVGRSCHTEAELLAAQDEGADYVTLSPVFGTASKPGYGPELGVQGLMELCGKVPRLPVVALGGIGPGRVAPCLAAGAAGVAVMGEVVRAEDPAALVRVLAAEARLAGQGDLAQ